MFNDDDDGMQLNFIRVDHKGVVISLVQHTISDKTTIQEVAILPEMDTIIHYDGSLDSLIDALHSIKNTMEKNP